VGKRKMLFIFFDSGFNNSNEFLAANNIEKTILAVMCFSYQLTKLVYEFQLLQKFAFRKANSFLIQHKTNYNIFDA